MGGWEECVGLSLRPLTTSAIPTKGSHTAQSLRRLSNRFGSVAFACLVRFILGKQCAVVASVFRALLLMERLFIHIYIYIDTGFCQFLRSDFLTPKKRLSKTKGILLINFCDMTPLALGSASLFLTQKLSKPVGVLLISAI